MWRKRAPAQFMRISTLSHCSVTALTRLSTASSFVMSVEMPIQARPGAHCLDSCAFASNSLSGFRAAITTLYPFFAKISAVARPTPCNQQQPRQQVVHGKILITFLEHLWTAKAPSLQMGQHASNFCGRGLTHAGSGFVGLSLRALDRTDIGRHLGASTDDDCLSC